MGIALVCISLLGLLVFGLGLAVSLTRQSSHKSIGNSSDPTDRLHKLVRAHGNTCEYAPILAILFFVVGGRNPEFWIHLVMILTTGARYAIVAGLVASPSLDKPHPLRFAGATVTYAGVLFLSLAVLFGS